MDWWIEHVDFMIRWHKISLCQSHCALYEYAMASNFRDFEGTARRLEGLIGAKFRLDRRPDLVKNDWAMLINVTQAVVLVVVVAGDAVGAC